MALTNKLTAIADAIRGKTGKTEEMTLDQMVTEIAGIQTGGGGDTAVEDGLVSGLLREYSNDRVTQLTSHLFYKQKIIETASFPNVTKINGTHIFSEASNLKSASFPKLVQGATHMFSMCSALKNIEFPLLNYVDASMLSGCGFESLTFPTKCEFYTAAVQNCLSLNTVKFNDGANFLRQNIFKGCTAMKTLVIGGNAVATLSYVNAFDGTPFASGGTGGTVYCPQALIEQYQQATNWSTLYAAGTCNFVAIEGSEYE